MISFCSHFLQILLLARCFYSFWTSTCRDATSNPHLKDDAGWHRHLDRKLTVYNGPNLELFVEPRTLWVRSVLCCRASTTQSFFKFKMKFKRSLWVRDAYKVTDILNLCSSYSTDIADGHNSTFLSPRRNNVSPFLCSFRCRQMNVDNLTTISRNFYESSRFKVSASLGINSFLIVLIIWIPSA